MTILFSSSFEKLVKFIFNFYDFDKDGYISREDIRVVLSYIPLNINIQTSFNKLKESASPSSKLRLEKYYN
jgi:Ca2+-binding EF-hand superfamily protein